MTNLPPPDPRSSQRDPLGFDEFIGIFVALSTIGAILLWTLAQRHAGLNLGLLPVSPSPSPQATATPPTATASPTPVLPTPAPPETSGSPTPLPTPTTAPSQSPRELIPFPLPERQAPKTQPATPAPVPTAAKPVNFVDVPQNYWARPYIDALAARGIVSGFTDNYFRPDQPVTRAEFAAILQTAFNKNLVGQRAKEFKDTPTDFWAVPAINRATSDQFLNGYPGDVFRPGQAIPRVQVLVALVSGLHLPTPPDPAKTLQIYQDAAQIPNYATNQVAAATQAKLVVNYPTQNLLNPNRNATRAEVTAIVYQALVQAGKAQPIQSQYVVQPPQ
ncbi:MAG: S-layer homology domain-containing protein [Chroococcidiopsidaceae cyanobacterium CP_BM_ER_R8_30]|nr:S-layer homology domain-containing protein [Chroococcidiopsidaceae cyanobacterium CP_BM_ER_R8_30]